MLPSSSSRSLLGCDTMECGRVPTFRKSMLPPSSRWSGPLKRWYPTATLHGVTTQKTMTLITEYYVISGSYEDSLKSLHQHTIVRGHLQHTSLMRRNDVPTRRRQRHNSISGDVVHLAPDIQQQPITQQHTPSVLIAAPTSALVRRASERSVVCPLTNEWKQIYSPSQMWCICGFDDFVIIDVRKFCIISNFTSLHHI